jgi:16S rRNA (cytosine967-C5)-methyltransferase
VAVHVLERVARDGAFAALALEAAVGRRRLDTRDAALATELVYGTLRWQRYLDWVLAPHSRRALASLDTRVLALLRLTAYQIAFLERVPSFAAVDDAVTLAGGKPGVAGFVNAVLRSFARRGVREREPAPPGDAVEALAIRCSFPTLLAERWVSRFGADDARALMLALNERPPLTVRTNTLRLSRDALAARLAAEEGRAPRPTRLAPEGMWSTTAGSPRRVARIRDNLRRAGRGLDAGEHLVGADQGDGRRRCSAPGTGRPRSAHGEPRRSGLTATGSAWPACAGGRRMGITAVETEGPAEALAVQHAASCDAILVDAPARISVCSAPSRGEVAAAAADLPRAQPAARDPERPRTW